MNVRKEMNIQINDNWFHDNQDDRYDCSQWPNTNKAVVIERVMQELSG